MFTVGSVETQVGLLMAMAGVAVDALAVGARAAERTPHALLQALAVANAAHEAVTG